MFKPALVVVAIALTLAGCASSPGVTQSATAAAPTAAAVPEAFVASGTVALKGLSAAQGAVVAGGYCSPQGGFSDINEGAPVVVSDSTGKTIALGSLDLGTWSGDDPATDAAMGDCTLAFNVPSVPGGAGFYGVQVSHRGVIQYTEAEMRAGISMSLSAP